jgi:nicotinamide phosphoribosyltransferase
MLDALFGSEVNSKGFRVLHPAVRVIQGDGINLASIEEILTVLTATGYSAENVAFGMGGALLQGVNRDTQKFAMKGSAIQVEGAWIGFNKAPVDDPGKASKHGRRALISEGQGYEDVPLEGNHWRNMLQPRYRDGRLLNETTYAEVRERAEHSLTEPVLEAA